MPELLKNEFGEVGVLREGADLVAIDRDLARRPARDAPDLDLYHGEQPAMPAIIGAPESTE